MKFSEAHIYQSRRGSSCSRVFGLASTARLTNCLWIALSKAPSTRFCHRLLTNVARQPLPDTCLLPTFCSLRYQMACFAFSRGSRWAAFSPWPREAQHDMGFMACSIARSQQWITALSRKQPKKKPQNRQIKWQEQQRVAVSMASFRAVKNQLGVSDLSRPSAGIEPTRWIICQTLRKSHWWRPTETDKLQVPLNAANTTLWMTADSSSFDCMLQRLKQARPQFILTPKKWSVYQPKGALWCLKNYVVMF